MVAKRKLTIETLSKLDRRRLAELLIAEAAGSRQLTQTLNFAILAEEGPAALGASLRKRLARLAKSRSMLSYDKGRELIAELDAGRQGSRVRAALFSSWHEWDKGACRL
jgi:hypothetical protein